jgi:hypothetical protein
MNSLKQAARKAGALYFAFALVAIFNEFYLSAGFVVPEDAAATARNIATAEFQYRMSILVSFTELIVFIVLVVMLYSLFKDVSHQHALLMVLFVTLGVGISLVNLVNKTGPLIFLSGADYLSVFSKAELDTLSMSVLRLRRSGSLLAMAFWGLWLFPFGLLVIKSGFIPKLFGYLLMVAGFAYVTTSFLSIGVPAHREIISKLMMPLYFGEVPIIFWLLIKGVKEVEAQPLPAR